MHSIFENRIIQRYFLFVFESAYYGRVYYSRIFLQHTDGVGKYFYFKKII